MGAFMPFDISQTSGLSGAYNLGNIYPNAFFDYLSRLMPRKLKTLFRWLEYLYVNCGQVFSVIKKFSEYPITTMIFKTEDAENSKRVKKLMEEDLKLKRAMIQVGIDYHIYGNSFTSIFRPFTRYLICKKCKNKHNALNHPYEWMPQAFEFKIRCSSCGHSGVAEVKHDKLKNTKKMRIIRWDPKDIDINWNPVTGETEYYYSIPASMKARIKTKKPDKFLINTLPWEFLQTMKQKRIFKFREGQLFHLKNPAPAGINQEWGYPGLLGCLKPYFYTAILRKGNEAIALERLVPWRILHPQASSNNNDPAQYVSLTKWRNELQDAIKKWRRDPNMIKLSPIPVGVTEVGGNARPLLTHQEVALTEENIITSMGVPKEFIVGGLTHAGGSVTLRMLENLMFTYTEQLLEFAQWATDSACNFTGLDKVEVDMTDFKLVDDIEQKRLLGTLYERKEISAKTFLETLDIDQEKEQSRMLEEAIAKAKLDKEMGKELKKLEKNLATEVDMQVEGNPLNYDPNAVMGVAEQEAMQLAQMPQDERKKRMDQLQMQDPVLLILAKTMLGHIQKQQRTQGAAMMGAPDAIRKMSGPRPEGSGGTSPGTPMAGR
jgi:hypothetical protein